MRRTETWITIAAVVLASAAAVRVPGRLLFALAAIVLLGIVAMLRISAASHRQRNAGGSAQSRAQAIRTARGRLR